MRRIGLIVFALIVFGLTLALVLENLSEVNVNYLFGSAAIPLAGVLGAALIVGAILGTLCAIPMIFKARNRARRARHRLSEVEEELRNLRRVPLRDAR